MRLREETIAPMPNQTAARHERASSAIGIARVLCVLGIVYVHAWTGLAGPALTVANESAQGRLRWVLIELLGRNAVPLLGMISGWLVAGSLRRRSWPRFVAAKARTLLAPMVLWNAIAILLVSGAATLGLIEGPRVRSLFWLVDELFCLVTPDDINVQMSFLRDLFVCMMLAPLMIRLPSRALTLIAMGVLVWTVAPFSFVLLLRPQILFFFLLGLLVRRHDLERRLATPPLAISAALFLLAVAMAIAFDTVIEARVAPHPALLAGFDMAMRVAAAWLCWSIAWRLAGARAGAALLGIEPYAFLLFCAHLIMMWLGGPMLGHFTGPLGSRFYPLYLLLQPALVLAATIALGRMLTFCSPPLARLLSGDRLGRPRVDAAQRPSLQPLRIRATGS